MTKKLFMPAITVSVALALASTQGGCYGSNAAFTKVHAWNGQATDSKVANSLIHFGLWIIPVYELVLLSDLILFNNVEFITGSNPLGGSSK